MKRNLIVILTHGLRSDALDDSQCWPLSTPNISKLIGRGVRLSVNSSCPADGGGMVSLFTGLHARQHGYIEQADVPDYDLRSIGGGWPAMFADAGYHTVGVGMVGAIKPWLTESVVVEPFEAVDPSKCAYMAAMRAKGMEKALIKQRRQRLRHGPFNPDRLLMESEDDIDGFIGFQARQAVTRMPTDTPWLLVVGYSGPGNDLPPPTLFETIVESESMEDGFIPADFKAVDALAELDYPRILLQRLDPDGLGRIRADYLGRVSLIDYGVGRLVSAIRDRSDQQRCWVVLGSDRGQLLGEHGLIGHRSFLTGAIRVPVIIAPPTPMKQKICPDLLSTIDVAATIAAIGACDQASAMVGRSLLPIASNQPLGLRRGLPGCISEFGRRLMFESERYKIVFNTESLKAIGLYDRIKDPDELNNLIGQSIGHDMVDALRHRLVDVLMPLRAMPCDNA